MKKHYLYIICVCFIVLGIFSCSDTVPVSKETSEKPILYPDYADVTIPNNIAPLNFKIQNAHTEAFAVFCFEEVKLQVKEKKGQFHIPAANWKKLLRKATGKTIQVKLYAKDKEWLSYPEFSLFIAQEPMDSYLAYRLIEPGYELWNQMGIYQRSLETYEQSPIMENKHSGQNCMNCHSFCMQNPNKMLFHMRDKYAGTYLIDGDKIEKLNTKTEQTISPLVYPSWHPSGKYVAFSVNQTSQNFHSNDKNRVEVFDSQSDAFLTESTRLQILLHQDLTRAGNFFGIPPVKIRENAAAKLLGKLPYYILPLRARPVHLIHKHKNRNPVMPEKLPQGHRMCLHAVRSAHHKNRIIQHLQRSLGFTAEIRVSRCVQKREFFSAGFETSLL